MTIDEIHELAAQVKSPGMRFVTVTLMGRDFVFHVSDVLLALADVAQGARDHIVDLEGKTTARLWLTQALSRLEALRPEHPHPGRQGP